MYQIETPPEAKGPRMTRFHPAAALLAAALASALPSGAAAAPQLRHQLLVNGDFTLFGNTLAHDCAAGVAPIVGTVGACGNNTSDSGVDIFWQSNPGAGTAAANTTITLANSQSTAVLSIPTGATVRYARLYWAGTVGTNAYDTAANLRTPDGTNHDITAGNGVVFLRPGGTDYWYQSSADVTSIVQGLAQPRGAYTFSGGASLNLVNLSSNTAFFAWWVVVFYEDPADTALRQLT